MDRVSVIGPPGSGKSTMARCIGAALGLPVVHFDTLAWLPGWVERPIPERQALELEAAARERWVIDGNYSATLDARIGRANMIVFLDLPRWLCISRIVKRRVMYARRARPDMTAGCPERLDLEFLRWAWNWRGPSRAKKLESLARADAAKVVTLRTRREVRRFLRELPVEVGA